MNRIFDIECRAICNYGYGSTDIYQGVSLYKQKNKPDLDKIILEITHKEPQGLVEEFITCMGEYGMIFRVREVSFNDFEIDKKAAYNRTEYVRGEL